MPWTGRVRPSRAATAWVRSAVSQKSHFEFGLHQFPHLIHCLATQMFGLGSGKPARLWEFRASGHGEEDGRGQGAGVHSL